MPYVVGTVRLTATSIGLILERPFSGRCSVLKEVENISMRLLWVEGFRRDTVRIPTGYSKNANNIL